MSECIKWWGTDGGRYGQMTLPNGRKTTAHRFIYEECFGFVDDGLVIDHLCKNTYCVNPEHLDAVTQRINVLRGRSPSAKNARKTHCKWGHPFTGDNLYIAPGDGRRVCRTCADRRREKHRVGQH